MALRSLLRDLLGWRSGELRDTPTFRCIRCGDEFERNYNACPSCNAQFVVRVDEES